MSELQKALVAVAVLVLASLYLAGKWQERRLLRRLRDNLHGGLDDLLLRPPGGAAPARIEPHLAGVAVVPAEPPPEVEAPAGGRPPEPATTAGEGGWTEDPLLDCVLELRFARAVDGVAVIDAAAALAAVGRELPVHFVVWDARARQWVVPDRFGYYNDALAAIQLANRRHVLDELRASRFVAAVQQVAAALDADFDPPDLPRLVAAAQELDRLCARFDVRISLTIESASGPWTAPRLDGAARNAGLARIDERSWERRDEHGQALFRLSSASLLTDRLALELDVPLLPAGAEPLRPLSLAADTLASNLGARVVDDNARPIDAQSLAAIEAQLARLLEGMRAAGIEPGSRRARRLYA